MTKKNCEHKDKKLFAKRFAYVRRKSVSFNENLTQNEN